MISLEQLAQPGEYTYCSLSDASVISPVLQTAEKVTVIAQAFTRRGLNSSQAAGDDDFRLGKLHYNGSYLGEFGGSSFVVFVGTWV